VDGQSTDVTRRLVGRERELAALRQALGRAGAGDPTVVLLVGDAGMGKTELVRGLLAEPDLIGVSAAGDEVETELSFGLVDQLLRTSPLGKDQVQDTLPGAGTDPLEAGAALLRLVDGLQLDVPLVVAVDDAHWADRPSLDALTFGARRLRADRVLLLVATRPEGLDRLPAGLLRLADATGGRIELAGLGAAAVRTLAADVWGTAVTSSAAERLRAHTGGNPLHVRALLRELSPDALVGGGPLPAPRSYATLVLARLMSCRPEAQRLVEALAVVGARAPLATVAAAAGLADPLPALDEAVEHRLVDLIELPGERSVAFTHPLVRAAVLDDLAPSRRAALHRAAAGAVPGAGGLRHRLAGCAGYDADLAAEARTVAAEEAAGGQHGSAARLSLEVARVAPDVAEREVALLTAVDQLLLAGDLSGARERRAAVDAVGPSALRSFVQGRLAYVLGPRRQARELLEKAWSEVSLPGGELADATLAGRIAALLATCAVDRADGDAGLRWSRTALGLARITAADCNHGHMLAMSSALQGRVHEGIDELTHALKDPPAHPAAVADLRLGRGVLRLWAHRLREATDDLAACLGSWGAGGTFVSRETARFFLAELHYRAGRWEDALVTAELATSVVDETDQAWLAAFSHAAAVYPLAARGEWARADEHLAAAKAAVSTVNGGAAGLWAMLAEMRLAEARNDPKGVVAIGSLLASPGARPIEEGIAPWRASHVEALVALDRLDDARPVVDALLAAAGDEATGSSGAAAGLASVAPASPLVRADAARAVAALAGASGDAVRLAAATGTLDDDPDSPGPFARGRLELAVGTAWRRLGERSRAARLLEAAHGRFAQLRATPWVERTERELAASGARSSTRASATGAALTGQEQAVCHLVARGRTNREAAAELFLSVKTVEHHLSRAYAKLGVRSRTALAHALAGSTGGTSAGDAADPRRPALA
jgi:DNA-binding CsgD family transcriptional regulator